MGAPPRLRLVCAFTGADQCSRILSASSEHLELMNNFRSVGTGVWRSLVARFVRDEEAVGSNPATPTGNRRDQMVPAIFA